MSYLPAEMKSAYPSALIERKVLFRCETSLLKQIPEKVNVLKLKEFSSKINIKTTHKKEEKAKENRQGNRTDY